MALVVVRTSTSEWPVIQELNNTVVWAIRDVFVASGREHRWHLRLELAPGGHICKSVIVSLMPRGVQLLSAAVQHARLGKGFQ
jgi:hypothetical protein